MFKVKDTLSSLTVSLAVDPEALMLQGNKVKTAEVRRLSMKNLVSDFSLNINQDFPMKD